MLQFGIQIGGLREVRQLNSQGTFSNPDMGADWNSATETDMMSDTGTVQESHSGAVRSSDKGTVRNSDNGTVKESDAGTVRESYKWERLKSDKKGPVKFSRWNPNYI